MDLLPWSESLMSHPARKHRVRGARNIRKTTAGFQLVTLKTLQAPWKGDGVLTMPHHNQAKRVLWGPVNQWLEDQPSKIKSGKENNTDLTIPLIDGKKLCLIGLDNYESKLGMHPVATLNDEAA